MAFSRAPSPIFADVVAPRSEPRTARAASRSARCRLSSVLLTSADFLRDRHDPAVRAEHVAQIGRARRRHEQRHLERRRLIIGLLGEAYFHAFALIKEKSPRLRFRR